MKTGKYKIEICNREDYEIHFYGDYPKQYYFEERVGAGETVSFTFNALQGVEFCIGMDCWYPGYDDEDGAEYTLLVTYEGEVLEWSEYM